MEDLSTYPTEIKLYEKIRIIGRGSFGQVWEAKIKLGIHKDEHVAIKEVDLEELADKSLDNLSQEITIMSSIKHENLIQTYTTCTLGHKIDIVMPLMDQGSLNFILCYKYPTGIKDVALVATIMKSCLEGLNCLNKNNLYHRDIKSANILLSTDGSIRLGDFGVAACIKPGAKKNSVVGSLNWMAPEMVKKERYDEKIDIWSMGITAIEIVQRNPPYYGMGTYDIMREIIFGDPLTQLKNQKDYDPLFIDFIKSCFIKDPKSRPNSEELLVINKKFFALAKDKKYVKENLLKGVPTVEERFEKGIQFSEQIPEENEQANENFVDWNFDVETETNGLNEDKSTSLNFTQESGDKLELTPKNSSKKDVTSLNKQESTNHMDKFKDMFADSEA